MAIISTQTKGKIILFGEHYIVYPNSRAILTTINLATTIDAQDLDFGENIFFESKTEPFIYSKYKIKSVREFYREARQLHQVKKYDKLKQLMKFPDSLIKLSLGVGYEFIHRAKRKTHSVDLKMKSDIPVSGFGSSAAVAANVLKIILEIHGAIYQKPLLLKLVMEVEKIIHISPSGVDPATVIFEGLMLFNKDKDNILSFRKLKVDDKAKQVLDNFAVIHTGKAEESTGEMVNNVVGSRFEKDFKKTNQIFKEIDSVVAEFTQLLESDELNGIKIVELINRNGDLLDQLGIISKTGREIIDKVKESGGAAKVSGAGGVKHNCGAILCWHKDQQILKEMASDFGCKYIKL